MPSRTPPKPRPRKKSIWTRMRQSYRARARAFAGPPAQAYFKEYFPLVEELIEEESIANTSSEKLNAIVREKARERAHEIHKKLRETMHHISVARALTLAEIYSPAKRKMIRTKMDFIFYRASPARAADILRALMENNGASFRIFYRYYIHTINFNEKYVNQLYVETKQRNKQSH